MWLARNLLTVGFTLAVCCDAATAQHIKAAAQDPAARVFEAPKDKLKIDGKLTEADSPLANAPLSELNGAPHHVFQVKLRKDQSYVIDLASTDFDAYAILQNAFGKVLAHDDDSGGRLNARIVYVPKADGVYRLLATALDRKVGAFQLSVRVGAVTADEQLVARADQLNAEGFQLLQQGRQAEALEKTREAFEIRQKIYPVSKYPDGHPDLANSLNNLGGALIGTGRPEQALAIYEQCLVMNRKLYPKSTHPAGHADLALSFNNMGTVWKALGAVEKALPNVEQALAMNRALYPESDYPDGHPDLAGSLNHMGKVLHAMGAAEKALPYFERTLAMTRHLYPESQYPNGHLHLATSLGNMGHVLQSAGSVQKALLYHEQALAMTRKLHPQEQFPNGHPYLAINLGNLGRALQAAGFSEMAVPYFEEALAMTRNLYPETVYPLGHPRQSVSLNNMAMALYAIGSAERALPYIEEALAIERKLHPESKFPDGHPELATKLSNLSSVLQAAGRVEKALPIAMETLAMWRQLYPESKYPDGHPELARGLDNLAFTLQAAGAGEKALPHIEQALAMNRKLGRRLLRTASEAEALAYLHDQPPTRDAYLSETRHMPAKAAAAYAVVWNSKSASTRVLEQRHAAARVAGTAAAAKLDDLKAKRRHIDQLLRESSLPAAERDSLIAKLADERDALERELAAGIPLLHRADELDALGPEALTPLLPEGAALIDVVRYAHGEFHRDLKGMVIRKRTPSYVAFVVANDASPPALPRSAAQGKLRIQRIELGAAQPIDEAVIEWRTALDKRTDSPAAQRLRADVWDKIAGELPAGAKTLYLAPDGDLARLPWAALPIGKGRVLLEDYAIAQVPHGPFLLEQLKHPRSFAGPDTLLTLGDVDYRLSDWPALPGTIGEINAIAALGSSERFTFSGGDVTRSRLTELLPKARYAHLATHGEFNAAGLAKEKQRAAKARALRQFGEETQTVAYKNPLGFVGLVMSNGDVLSGLSILDMPLENLKMVTLSACETGLGETTAGEGVQGLQRAFHLAGCPNVVASLWKVNDAATAALMSKFYHEMWVNKKPPIEALRAAQLTVYHHPELIPDLAGERGAPRLKEAVAVRLGEPSGVSRRSADTKLWAAFVLSGVGR